MKKLVLFSLLIALAQPVKADPVMDRINKSGVIKCGYVSYSPASVKDVNSGKMVGYNVDIIEKAAERMGLKVDWSYETNWPTMSTDLQTNKFDMACVTYWNNPRSARQMLSTDPVFYQPVFFATRVDDTRFDDDISQINAPNVKISVLEGDVPETIIHELYPKAQIVALPQTASFAQVFQEVASKRADVTITSIPDMNQFSESNPDTLKIITNQPVRLYPTVMQMPADANLLQNAMNTAIREMQLDGSIEKILKKYATRPDDFYLIQSPYTKITPKHQK